MTRKMNERQIEAFRATAHAGTVTGAARILNISQPAVSRLLADLEHGLDLALFERIRGRLRLTPEGSAFLGEVDRHFVGLNNLGVAARRIAAHGTGNLSILGIPSATSGFLPHVITKLLQDHPRTTVTLDTDTTDRIASQVESGAYDIGFATLPVAQGSAVNTRILVTRPWVCVFPTDHEFAKRRKIALRDMAAIPLVGFSPGMSLRQRVDRIFAARDRDAEYKICAQTIESICALVAAGCGGAVIHPYATHVARMHGLVPVILDEPATLDLVAVTPLAMGPSYLVDALIALTAAFHDDGLAM